MFSLFAVKIYGATNRSVEWWDTERGIIMNEVEIYEGKINWTRDKN